MNTGKKLYALMAGINHYAGPVSDLSGSVNDMENFKHYLEDSYRGSIDLCIETLKNSDATRGNIIRGFREHLRKARENDVVLFYYSGHGSRQSSAPEFKEFFPEGLDETLVCYDSRMNGGQDLADKELAVLLSEVAVNHPHIAVVLDCCHSGSLTRNPDSMAKLTTMKNTNRPLKSYLDGWYNQHSLTIPQSPHVLLAACKRNETAWEINGQGAFTRTLLEILERRNNLISYADLFVSCRFAIRKRIHYQTPQFESYGGFNAYTAFLDGAAMGTPPRCTVYFDKVDNSWKMNRGALHEIPTDTDKITKLTVYQGNSKNNQYKEVGQARTTAVNTQVSKLELDFIGDKNLKYKAEIRYFPIPPLLVHLEGNRDGKKQIKGYRKKFPGIAFTHTPKGVHYQLSARKREFLLTHIETGILIQGSEGYTKESAQYILSILEQIRRWENSLEIQNPGTKFNREKDVDFIFVEMQEDGKEFEYSQPGITLDFKEVNGGWRNIPAKIKARNNTDHILHFVLFHFSRQFGIHVLANEPLPPKSDFITLWGSMDDWSITLPDGTDDAVDNFKLIVSTERVDSFLLEQEDLMLGKIARGAEIREDRGDRNRRDRRDIDRTVTDDWFTKIIRVRTVRQQAQVRRNDLSLCGNRIIIKGHKSFTANISLYPSRSPIKTADPMLTIPNAFEGDFEILEFPPAQKNKSNVSILELTDIRNVEKLKENPLEIRLNIPTKEDEMVLPLTFDGTHFLMVGNPSKDEKGKPLIQINHIPGVKDEKRRAMAKTLKLFFLKLKLKKVKTNQLRWVEYEKGDPVTVNRHEANVKEKVAKAQNILLIIHGLIGDTEPMVKGLKFAADKNNKSIVDHYDLILTFDYENLDTPIEETSQNLKHLLKEVGLPGNQDKKITILAHAGGGLVARWLIEREGGNKIVNRLIMAGTPNNGAVYRDIIQYRKLAITLLTISLNFHKPFIAYTSAFLLRLNQPGKITRPLEQMIQGSPFLNQLNLSSDPKVKYTVLAGDITHYDVGKDVFFNTLLGKIEMSIGKLDFRNRPNDIAVDVESIKNIDESREPTPDKIDLICHHLDYFDSEATLDSLTNILPSLKNNEEEFIMNRSDNHLNPKPVIFLAAANDREEGGKYLRNLPKEISDIRDALLDAERAKLCEVVYETNITINRLYRPFLEYGNRIAIFHYAGHANSYQLLLETINGGHSTAYRVGLVDLLSQQKGLKLVFLNGCTTEQHAQDLVQAGIPAVVGTSQYIADDVALELALWFYKCIGKGFPVERSWKTAVSEIKTCKGEYNFRDLYCKGHHNDRFPWDIYYKKGAESVKDWNLPDAANDPLFGLPEIPNTYGLPASPFLFLKRYESNHAKVFFGRSYYIRKLYNKIFHPKSPPIILLYGQSGVGKSSLLDAGLIPRLEGSHIVMYVRRTLEKGILGTLNQVLDDYPLNTKEKNDPQKPTAAEKWKRIESDKKKPLVIILDQLEEMYTRPNEKLPSEFNEFLEVLKELFQKPALYPAGKLILGYRKEYHPEIDKCFGRYELPRSQIFLEPLKRNDIIEVVTGLTKTTELRDHYNNIEVEETLPVIIADDLSEDKKSPIAPVLQIILFKMWNNESNKHSPKVQFKVRKYQELLRLGIAMKDFFHQQMEDMENLVPDAVESGLALDLLKFHTTELGTSCSQNIENTRKNYSHRHDMIDDLVQKLVDLYLLTYVQDSKKEISLTHDTLAPIVIKEFNDSDKPGQRAARIMATKMKEYRNNQENTLDEADLEIVENGRKGMRALNDDEEKLLKESKSRKDQHEKLLNGAEAIMLTSNAQEKVKKDPTIALRIAEKAYQLDKNKNVIQAIHKIYRESVFYKIVLRQETPISALALSPDGKYILTGLKDKDWTICLWDLEGKKEKEFKGHTNVVNSVAFSQDNKYILSGSSDRSARLWNLEEGKELQVYKGHRRAVNAVAFSGEDNCILTGSRDGIIRKWDRQGKELKVLNVRKKGGRKKSVTSITFSPDSKLILTGSTDKIPRLWDLQEEKEIQIFKGHKNVTAVAFSPDSKDILTGAKDGSARLWDLQGKKLQIFNGHKRKSHKRNVTFVNFSPDSNLILTGSIDKTARLWDRKGKELLLFKGHTNHVTFVTFWNEGRFILSGSEDKTIRRWDLQGNKFKIYKGHQKAVNSVAFSPDGKNILTGSNDNTTILWVREWNPLQNFTGHKDAVTSVAFSSDSKSILTGSRDKTARLWSLGEKKEPTVFKGHKRVVNAVAFSHDDKYILTGSSDKTAILWNRAGGKIRYFLCHKCAVTSVAFSVDSELVLTGSRDKTACLWDRESGRVLQVFIGHEDYVTAVAFSPDKKHFLTGSRDETARLWDLEGKTLKTFQHNEIVNSVAFSSEDNLILTGSGDKTTILWDMKGNRLQDFIGHKDSITSVAFSRDSKFILTGSKDKTAREWEIKKPLEEFLKSGDCEEITGEIEKITDETGNLTGYFPGLTG